MKFFLTIVLAVFIGNLASLSAFELWRSAQAEKAAALENQKLAEQQRIRDEQGAKIRQMLLDAHKGKGGAIENGDGMPSAPDGHEAE